MYAVLVASLLAAPNVVFISVDTLRADCLGCYGHRYATSPNIDELSRNALVFEDCVCEVPLTAPSFGAMLTSQYPRTTGLHRNGLRMPQRFPTVAEQFCAAGYQTFCVQSNWTLKADLSGLDRGFETYDDHFHKKRWGVIKPERYADEVTDITLKLIEARDPARPLFCWVHYSDPHAPYLFHKEFNPRGRSGLKARLSRKERVRAKYESEVAYADFHIGRLLEALPQENTFLLFVADHGESLYEHNYLGHGRRIYQPGVHIPLIVRGPGVTPGRSEIPARGIDIGPTLLGLAGIPAAPGMLGVDLLRDPPSAGRVRVIETYGGAVPKVPGAKGLMAGRPPQWQGVLVNGWKLILGDKKEELYSLSRDPLEEKNLADEESERVSTLRACVAEWNRANARGFSHDAELGKEDIEALKSLGYIR